MHVRHHYQALSRVVNGRIAAFLDGPGGTQMPNQVIEAMAASARAGRVANLGGKFCASEETGDVVRAARGAAADLLNCAPEEVFFGQNMTSLTFAVSRALARTWEPGANIVLSRADHDANVGPWLTAAGERGVEVRWVDVDPARGCALDMDSLDAALDGRTALVAFTAASNTTGTVSDAAAVVSKAHAAGARTFVDGVHFTPHARPDVKAMGTDFYACSAYKFFGPHVGICYGTAEVLASVQPYKVRPSPTDAPWAWETGTQNYTALAGVEAAVDYLAGLAGQAPGPSRAERLERAFKAVGDHEAALSERFLKNAASVPGLVVHGMPTPQGRTPTFAIDLPGRDHHRAAAFLGARGVFVWSGSFYAVELMRRLNAGPSGLLRVGFVHYNTLDEADRVVEDLELFLKQ